MKTLEWFNNLFEAKKDSIQYSMLPPERTRLTSGKPTDNTELEAGKHYFRLWLVEMFLANDRKWLTDWFPVVHTAVNIKFGDQRELLTHIAGESFLNQLGRQKPGRIVGLNYPLTPLLPFNGGSIELDAGLIGVAGGNSVLAALQILGNFSQLLVVPQLSAALAVAMPLADGVAKFIGATENQMLLGLHQSWASESGGANVLRAGYFVVIAADDKINLQNLFVIDDGLRHGDRIETSTPLTGYDYMLFRIESRDERDDWDSLSAIQKPFERAIEMLQSGNIEQANAFIRTAIAAAFTAKELTTKVDRRRVIDQLQQAYQDANSLFGSVTRGARGFEDFADDFKLSSLMKNAEEPAKAAKKGILPPLIVGLDGLVNHSLKSSDRHLSYINNYETRGGIESLDIKAVETPETGEDQKESFFFNLEGDHVRGNTVQKGSMVDFVFDYAVPKGNVISLVTGEKLEAARRADAALGLMVSPRVYYAMARDGLFFRKFGELHPRFGTPHRATIIQMIFAVVLILSGTFEQIIAYFFFVVVVFIALAVAGIFRIHGKEFSGYKTSLYPLTPVFFLLVTALVLFFIAMRNPLQSFLGVAVVLAGLPVYYLILGGQEVKNETAD